MLEVLVIVEGQTEERFIKQLIAPALHSMQIFVKPLLLRTSKENRGGSISFDRLRFHARNTLRQHQNAVISTFLDLYALDTSFPDFDLAQKKNILSEKVGCLNNALHQAIVSQAQCRSERFIAHIQPHEFEGLLFSDPVALTQVEPSWMRYSEDLVGIRTQYDSPEHINNGYETAPSRRLEKILRPGYKKTRHGPLAAQKVTLEVMERECFHFRSWMSRLRNLARSFE